MSTMSNGKPISYDINLPYGGISPEERERLKRSTLYPQYLPTFDKIWFDPLPEFPFTDPALRADKTLRNLLTHSVSTSQITPRMGTILQGVQLTQLSDAARDELALLVSERKVVVFPDQEEFLKSGPQHQQDFMAYFGKPNYQPVSGSIQGYPGFHIIHRDGNKEEIDRFFERKTTSTLWHQDVSYERQPPGYVMLGILQGPEVGGDTVFAATDEAYKRFSPLFRTKLDDLKAIHSSRNMIHHARSAGGLVRKDPVEFVHPLVRVHPVTRQKCLFLNGEFISGIQDMKDTESKLLLDFILDNLIKGHDFQARVSWKPNSVVVFDNRSTIHTAVVDYIDEESGSKPRHIFRLASMAEVPIPVPEISTTPKSSL